MRDRRGGRRRRDGCRRRLRVTPRALGSAVSPRPDHQDDRAGPDRHGPGGAAPPPAHSAPARGAAPRDHDRGWRRLLRAADREDRHRGSDPVEPHLLPGFPRAAPGTVARAGAQPRGGAGRPRRAGSRHRRDRDRDPPRLAGPGPLRPGARRAGRAALPAAQVPHDVRDRRGALGMGAGQCRPDHAGWAAGSGGSGSTSCPSS